MQWAMHRVTGSRIIYHGGAHGTEPLYQTKQSLFGVLDAIEEAFNTKGRIAS